MRVDGGRDGFGRCIRSAGLDHGVKTGTGEARSANEVPCRSEFTLIIRLRDGRPVCESRTVVEPLINGGRDMMEPKGKCENERREHNEMLQL